MREPSFDDLHALIVLFRETASEGKMALFDEQFSARLEYDRDHEMCHIRLEYVCSLNATSCAMMTDRLVQKIVEAGLDTLPIICSFTNVIKTSKVKEEPAEKTITVEEYAKSTGLSVHMVLDMIKPEHLRIAIPT